eukprot:1179955-Prorocentrum_minimum.AAC.4
MVTPNAVPHILHHCLREHQLCLEGQQRYGKIGQGGILYGSGEVENWITTLADSLRVADDYGKFRVQFEMNECWVRAPPTPPNIRRPQPCILLESAALSTPNPPVPAASPRE